MHSRLLNPETKKRTQSEKRMIKLEKIGFELEAQRLRKQYSNVHLLGQMKMKAKSNRKLLTEIPEKQSGHFLEPTKIISVTAHKWVICDYYTGKYIRGYRARDTHSLTVFSKLLVFCAVNTLAEKYKLDTSRFETIVTPGVHRMHPNQCHLKADDIVSLQDLLHLMIMEESQIYETVLAANVGAFLEKKRQKQYYSVFDANDKSLKQHLKLFYELVNSYCKLLKLDNIRYVDAQPHNRKEKNKCSAADVAILSIECMKIPLFQQILRKLHHSVKVKFVDSEGRLVEHEIVINNKAILNKYIPYFNVCRNWEENNFMDSHCSIFYENHQEQIRPIIIVLLGCYGPSDREKDIQQVTQWYIKNKNKSQSLANLDDPLTQPPAKKMSAHKLPTLQKSVNVQDTINKKLKADKAPTSRYDDAIRFKNRSTRLKTQF